MVVVGLTTSSSSIELLSPRASEGTRPSENVIMYNVEGCAHTVHSRAYTT